MRMIYKSDNGLTGVFEEGNFLGFEHYDLSVFKTDTNSLIFHATLTEPITYEELKEKVDELPEFMKMLMEVK